MKPAKRPQPKMNISPSTFPFVDESNLQSASGIPSEIPIAPAKLSPAEKKIWDHVTQALLEYGLIHRTDGMALVVIVRTFQRWVEAEDQLTKVMKENNGSYMVTTPNGFAQPHQIYYIAKNMKKELLQWLPEAALTIPSFQKITGDRVAPQQGALFDDPVEAHKKRGTVVRMTAPRP